MSNYKGRPLTPAEQAQEQANHCAYIKYCAQKLVQDAVALGVVLTIEAVPLEPLAMRNYAHHVAVRVAR